MRAVHDAGGDSAFVSEAFEMHLVSKINKNSVCIKLLTKERERIWNEKSKLRTEAERKLRPVADVS